MIRLAMEESAIALNAANSINCPDNQNIKKEKQIVESVKRTENSLGLKIIMDDFVLPTKTVKQGKCRKKNASFGFSTRYLLMGSNQIIIARDPDFKLIVNIIPLEGGFCIVTQPPKEQCSEYLRTVHIITLQRLFEFQFDTADEAESWCTLIHMCISH